MRKRWIPTSLAAMLLVGIASAAEENFAVKGVGATTCRDYLAAREKGSEVYLLYGGYIAGYVTAVNQHQPETFDLLPWQSVDTLTRMLASFCEKSPDSLFAAVLSRLAKLIEPERLAVASPTLRAGGEADGVTIYVEALRRTQEQLAARGLYEGKADGRFGSGTRGALERFQQANGLPATGLPDQVTLFLLYYPPSGDD